MKEIDYWRLCDELTVRQAAILIMGEDPSDYQSNNIVEKPYEAITNAIMAAIDIRRIEGNVVREQYGPEDHYSTVGVDSLKEWLRDKGIESGFFFPGSTNAPDYLNREHPKYSPKLAAAVSAWLAVSSDSAFQDNGQSVKANIVNWLTAHAAEYGLLKEDMTINVSAIKDQIAVVSNFKPGGGAPMTPEGKPTPKESEPTPPSDDFDGDIPF